jgi:hypothetical protein
MIAYIDRYIADVVIVVTDRAHQSWNQPCTTLTAKTKIWHPDPRQPDFYFPNASADGSSVGAEKARNEKTPPLRVPPQKPPKSRAHRCAISLATDKEPGLLVCIDALLLPLWASRSSALLFPMPYYLRT